jgi:hypothetical protein
MVESIILKLLHNNKNLYFLLCSPFSKNNKIPNHNRLIKNTRVSYFKMLYDMSKCHTIIAPLKDLDIGSRSKSNLKYLESSLVMSNLIATPIDDMSSVKDAKIAYANSLEDWESLLQNTALNKFNAENALFNNKYVLNNFMTPPQSKKLLNIIESL